MPLEIRNWAFTVNINIWAIRQGSFKKPVLKWVAEQKSLRSATT